MLDDDVAFLARELAASSRRSVGQVIPDLARRGYQSERQQSLAQAPGGGEFPQLPSRGGTVTNEQVNRLREELGI